MTARFVSCADSCGIIFKVLLFETAMGNDNVSVAQIPRGDVMLIVFACELL